jgi:hypothetical protein
MTPDAVQKSSDRAGSRKTSRMSVALPHPMHFDEDAWGDLLNYISADGGRRVSR